MYDSLDGIRPLVGLWFSTGPHFYLVDARLYRESLADLQKG